MVVLLRGEQRTMLHRSGFNAVLQMFVLTIGDGLTFFREFLDLLLAMSSRELRLELCWDQAYTQDFPTSEAFTCKVTWYFGLLLTSCSRESLLSGIAQSSLGVIIMPGTRTSQLRATHRWINSPRMR